MQNQYDPQYIRQLFNKMSGSYERVNYITSFGFSLRWRKQFLQPLRHTNEPVEVLDLMTGMGETWGPVKRFFPNAGFTALDFSEGMLEYARKKNERKFCGKVNVTLQNALQSNFPDERFDVILSAFGLKTFNETQQAQLAREIYRLLKPGGTFSMIEVSRPDNVLLKFLYRTHLKYVVPVCGRLMLGNPQEYKMLWRYTDAYGDSRDAVRIFSEAGLDVQFESYFGGCATGVSGRKPVEADDRPGSVPGNC